MGDKYSTFSMYFLATNCIEGNKLNEQISSGLAQSSVSRDTLCFHPSSNLLVWEKNVYIFPYVGYVCTYLLVRGLEKSLAVG